ncbi:LuxR C-terminal-related transcriptional regulator [Rathayibacter soli]|uniref:LuxR C-terminal-related transcriptional regulator n=1 Tax=Rathayibacter soli TaxID=3144168 RepID=UPI0027E52D3B|nr:LuxR C-terminal-related transcriptional regulator [Glaciibacter superstes]
MRSALDDSLATTLTLLIAQAGAGKTVLLSQWASSHPELDFVWLDIVAADNDPAYFVRRLLAGLPGSNPEIKELAQLVALHDGGLGTPFLDAVSEAMGDLPPLVIVLDDLHHLFANQDLVSDLVRLVDVVPPNVHLVFSARSELPVTISRRRLQGALTDVRGADLALDSMQSAELIARISGRTLSPHSIAILTEQAEGWAAGLQLAGLALRAQDNPDEFITRFTGTDRFVADYLREEVLQSQPVRTRTMLLRVSVLENMCADLVTFVTGEPEAQGFFEELERKSMFLVPLDNRREWFRFNHLFRDFLRSRLHAESTESEAEMLTKAARWHLDREEVHPAVEYLLRAQKWESAEELIRARGSEIFERGEMLTMIRWITALPQSRSADELNLTLLLGFLRGLAGQTVAAEDILRRAMNHPRATIGQRVVASALIAGRVQWSPHPETSVDFAVRALRLLEEHPHVKTPDLLHLTDRASLLATVLFSGGRAHFLAGNLVEARRWLQRSLASEGAEYSPWRVSALGSLALVEAWSGRLHDAEESATEALNVAKAAHLIVHSVSADAYLALALIALERSEPHRAALALHEGLVRASSNRRAQLLWVQHVEVQLLRAASNDPTESAPPDGPPPAVVRDRLKALHGRQQRLAGSTDHTAQAWPGGTPTPAVLFERVATALTLGQPEYARTLLARVASPAPSDGPLVSVEHLILQAWLMNSVGELAQSQALFERALELAETNDLVDVFLRGGPHVIKQLAQLPEPRSAFLARVLHRAAQSLPAAPGAELPEPLTYREREILAYLPSRFTNLELAERCFVSVNTIKTHIVHIYRKLDAPNRSAAIERARELGLLV